jgi:hypothetical protein
VDPGAGCLDLGLSERGGKGERDDIETPRAHRIARGPRRRLRHSTRPNLPSKARPKRSVDHPRMPIFPARLCGSRSRRWPDAESKKIRTAVSSSAAVTGRRTRQSPGAIPVLTKGHARSTAPTTFSRPRARRPNLTWGSVKPMPRTNVGVPARSARARRLGLGRHQPAGRQRLLKRWQFRDTQEPSRQNHENQSGADVLARRCLAKRGAGADFRVSQGAATSARVSLSSPAWNPPVSD